MDAVRRSGLVYPLFVPFCRWLVVVVVMIDEELKRQSMITTKKLRTNDFYTTAYKGNKFQVETHRFMN